MRRHLLFVTTHFLVNLYFEMGIISVCIYMYVCIVAEKSILKKQEDMPSNKLKFIIINKRYHHHQGISNHVMKIEIAPGNLGNLLS